MEGSTRSHTEKCINILLNNLFLIHLQICLQVSDLAMGIFANTNYRDTLVDFPHLMPDPSILTVISWPKYYANNELFQIFNTFKLEVWLIIGIIFVKICGINGLKTSLDYFSLLLGKGIIQWLYIIKKDK